MGLFDRLIKRDKQTSDSKEVTMQLGTYGGLTPTYEAIGSELIKSNEAAMSCIKTNALYCSKVDFQSIRIQDDGQRFNDYPKLDKLLQFSPNPLQTAAVFWERTAFYYYKYNNAFIYIEKDDNGNIIALWSLDPSSVRFTKIVTGEIILKFELNGRSLEALYSDIIHIAREVTENNMFGDNTSNQVLRKVIKLINLNYQGIENAILTSAAIKFIGKVNTKLNDAELKKRAKKFTKQYLQIGKAEDAVGVAFTDSSLDLTPIQQNKQETAKYEDSNAWNQAVYKYYGCPEKVIAGTANEEEMTAYYERTPEVFFMRAAQEMTRKIFTDREFEVGNRIVYSDKKILFMSMKTRLQIFNSAREVGCFTLGTLGDLIGLPVPNNKRDTVVTSQNYQDSLKDGKGKSDDDKNDENEEENPTED